MGKTKSVIVKDMDHCYACGRPFPQLHHIMFGPNRKLSDRFGYVVPLCQGHHTGKDGVHFNRDFDLHLKKTAQLHFERHHGTREEFIKIFGRSYL